MAADLLDIREIASKVAALRKKHASRDTHAAEVSAVLNGNFDQVAPGLFSDEWPRPIVANRVEVMVAHASAALSPLPIVSCQSVTATSEAARDFADRRSKIANHYLKRSRVQAQMQTGSAQFYAYGLLVTAVEPDFDDMFPDVLMEHSVGFYPLWDRKGRTVAMARVFTRTCQELCAEFPDWEGDIQRSYGRGGIVPPDHQIEVIKYVDAKRVCVYLSDKPEITLVDHANPVGQCTYVATLRPGVDKEIRGKFDDLIWVQLALHAMQTYTLSAAAQAVNAPFAAPLDTTDIEIGPGAVIRSNNPDQIRRVGMEVPQGAWIAQESLKDELEYGAITPEALGGSIDASVVTGKGVQQLMAGYSQQIAMSQEALVGHFEQVLQLCFKVDETFWPSESKAISGHAEGTPYKLTYRAGRDIAGDHTVEVQYGGIAGLDPNRGLVFLLQALGAGLVSNDYVRRHLPSDMNPADEETKIIIEQVRNSLVQGLSAYIQSIPQMEANGQDPSTILVRSANLIKELEKGRKIEDVLKELFPEPAPAPEQDPMAALMAGAGGPGGEGGGMAPNGMPPGLKPGIATEGPGGRPPLEMLFAGTNSAGTPNLQAGVSRMSPARTV
jgi:hypothetical protein